MDTPQSSLSLTARGQQFKGERMSGSVYVSGLCIDSMVKHRAESEKGTDKKWLTRALVNLCHVTREEWEEKEEIPRGQRTEGEEFVSLFCVLCCQGVQRMKGRIRTRDRPNQNRLFPHSFLRQKQEKLLVKWCEDTILIAISKFDRKHVEWGCSKTARDLSLPSLPSRLNQSALESL